MVNNAFYFNGASSLEHSLVIESKNILTAPEPDIKEYEVLGRNGSVFLSNKRYRNVEIEYSTFLQVPQDGDIERYTTQVKSWLLAHPGEYLRLEDSYDLSHYRKAAYITGLDLENNWRRFTRQSVVFSCYPYRYLKSGEKWEAMGTGESLTLYNPTAFNSEPDIKFVFLGSYTGTWSFNIDYEDGTSCEVTVRGVGVDAYLDGANKVIREGYDPPGAVMSHAVLSQFPIFKPGLNVISVTFSSESSGLILDFRPNWREL